MRFIVDTNLLVSAIIKPISRPGMALEKAMLKGKLCFSQATATELNEVLRRNKFDRIMPPDKRLAMLDALFDDAILITDNVIPIVACRDPKDDRFLEPAVSAKADMLITGDKDLLILHPFRGIPIISAIDFLSILL